MDSDNIGPIVAAILYGLYHLYGFIKKRKKESDDQSVVYDDLELDDAADDDEIWNTEPVEEDWPETEYTPEPEYTPVPDVTSYQPELVDAAREAVEALRESVQAHVQYAEDLIEGSRRDRANDRFIPILEKSVLQPAAQLQRQLLTLSSHPDDDHHGAAAEIEFVLDNVAMFIGQRRNPELRQELGDADAIADACYQPLFDFAVAKQLPLTSFAPVALLTNFSLSTWTGFIPTGLAPLFLPRDFFQRLAWWPAIAHEIAHDFLAATGDAESRLRDELGLVSEAEGVVPLSFHELGDIHGLFRVFGAWFEEFFCDIVGTMMVGPAYGYAMVELFASPPPHHNRIAHVAVDQTGYQYDVHPPRHLRLLLAADVLRLIGEDEAADDIIERWTEIHGEPEGIVFPTTSGLVELPIEPLVTVGRELATRMYRDPLEAFDGHALSAIPGLDYGPHESQEVRRAKAELLRGVAPKKRSARAVVGGAVLAWIESPEQEEQLIILARRAIVGVAEWSDHARGLIHEAEDHHAVAGSVSVRDAFVLHTILAAPPGMRGMRRRGSFLDRPSAPS